MRLFYDITYTLAAIETHSKDRLPTFDSAYHWIHYSLQTTAEK